jgi:hypothetical protein
MDISNMIKVNERLRTVCNSINTNFPTKLVPHEGQIIVYSDNNHRINTIIEKYNLVRVSTTINGVFTIATLTA